MEKQYLLLLTILYYQRKKMTKKKTKNSFNKKQTKHENNVSKLYKLSFEKDNCRQTYIHIYTHSHQ